MSNILITGASRGIGKAIALYLAEHGYDLVLHCSKNPERLDELKKEIQGVNVRTLAFDISNREETKRVLEKDIEEIDTLRKIDIFDYDSIRNEYLLEDIRKYGKQIY